MALVAAVLWALVIGLIAMYGVLFCVSALQHLLRPTDELIYGESWLLDGARRVARGEGLYGPVTQVPMMHIAYTPLYYLVVGGLQRLVGDHGYVTGRVVSVLATVAGAGALAWSVQRMTSRWAYGWLAAGLFLTQNLTALLWASLNRVDALAVGLTLVGLALFSAGRPSLAAGMFLLALLTKQTFFIAPAVALLALWPCRASMLRFAGLFLGGAVLMVLVGQWLTGGWFLWHTVAANGNEPDLSTFAALMGSFAQFNGVAVLAALAAFTLPAVPGERVWRLYFLAGLASLATVAKLGASSNYWLELSAAVAVLLAVAACKLAAWPALRMLAPTILAGALLVAVPAYQATAMDAANTTIDLVQSAGTQSRTGERYISLIGDGEHYAPPIRVDSALVDMLANEPGDVLTDNSGLAVAAGKRIAYEFQIFQLLNAEGRWPEQPIDDAINARRFSLVALMHPLDGPSQGTRWMPGLVAALQAAYVPVGEESGFWLYRPRQ